MLTLPEGIESALGMSPGAVFTRAALQVNPFSYLSRKGVDHGFTNAQDYNRQLVDSLVDQGISIIGITDHDTVENDGLRTVAEASGITVFPGVELRAASTGVHICILFDPKADEAVGRDFVGWAEVDRRPEGAPSPCNRTDRQIMERAAEVGAVTYFPHVESSNGLFGATAGQARIETWCHELTRAVAVTSPFVALGSDLRAMLDGRKAEYVKGHPTAIIHANDVYDPSHVHDRSWTWIKLSEHTAEGLRQAFLDPESRVRRADQMVDDGTPQILAVGWTGGFLDGVSVRLSSELTVLVGGRGAGKSTIIESLRYALDLGAVGDVATKMQTTILPEVLGDGGTVHVLMEKTDPSSQRFLVQRTIGGAPRVTGETGADVARAPAEIVPNLELFGQHEISDYARDDQSQVRLLDRFLRADVPDIAHRLDDAGRTLARSRRRLGELQRALDTADIDLQKLAKDEERLAEYDESGVEEALTVKSAHDEDSRLFTRAAEAVGDVQKSVSELVRVAELDTLFLSEDAIEDRPGEDELRAVRVHLDGLTQQLRPHLRTITQILTEGTAQLRRLREPFSTRQASVEAAYEKARTTLGREASSYVALRERVAALPELRQQQSALTDEIAEVEAERRELLERRGRLLAELREAYERAARTATHRLGGSLRVAVLGAIDTDGVERIIRDAVGGQLHRFVEAVEQAAAGGLSTDDLVLALRTGPDEAVDLLEESVRSQAERVCVSITDDALGELEELDPALRLRLELNVGTDPAPDWRTLDRLSTGQRATAILLLILADSDAPLIVDQPEDDLDNAFIAEVILPRLRDAKRRRQVLLSTHNANLPVLGDAEQILVLEAEGTTPSGPARTHVSASGAIDDDAVRAAVEELLEGGRTAFERRRLKYGF